jgi:hypothetical protein
MPKTFQVPESATQAKLKSKEKGAIDRDVQVSRWS